MKRLIFAFASLLLIATATSAHADSVYDRVISSGKIRCGYFSRYPALIKDPKTNEFTRMLDHATNELHMSGVIDKIIDKYEKYPGALYRVAKPYELPQ